MPCPRGQNSHRTIQHFFSVIEKVRWCRLLATTTAWFDVRDWESLTRAELWSSVSPLALHLGKKDFLILTRPDMAPSGWLQSCKRPDLDPLTAGAVHIRILHFLLAHYISAFKHVKDKKWHQPAIFEKSWPPFCQIWIIFTHLKLWIASARHNFKWVKILIE